eukprot:TRINITY_DN13723_c0_g1_i1.p1 TRINITY_DN13723_c0_g1~~TRINITY_DN13723_c0_g1_i1.p1  ORF type:complete len:111 (+),score=37.29 TRINITY_DN13723_c0_g1_i1:27-335(+)
MIDLTAEKTDEQSKSIAKKMLIVGCFLLPCVWLIMPCYFFDYLRSSAKRSAHTQRIRLYVMLGGVGAFLELTALLVWMAVYLTSWEKWGATGEALCLIAKQG